MIILYIFLLIVRYDCPYDNKIKAIKINSKEVIKEDLFVCTKGVNSDGHDFYY